MKHLSLMLLTVCSLAFASMDDVEIPESAYGRRLTVAEKAAVKREARLRLRDLKNDLRRGEMDSLAVNSDAVIDRMIALGVKKLRERGDAEGAAMIESSHRLHYRGYLTRMVRTRDIGDHKPLLQWLATVYDRMEFVLGVSVMKATHLSDLKTFNYAIPVVFRPCSFPMDAVTIPRKDEYRNHFAKGTVYIGLVPVIAFWTIDISCMVGTAGLASLLCGPVASVGEWLMAAYVAPKLSDFVFSHACE